MKERFQEIDAKNDQLVRQLKSHSRAKDYLERFELSWVYHDSSLEGTVYTPQELQAALMPHLPAKEASLMPVVLEIRNHKAAIDYARAEAKHTSKKSTQISLAVIKRLHDLFLGNTPEAQAARAAVERREKSEKELAKERERAGFRKDMPLHRTYFHDIAQPGKIQAGLDKLVEVTAGSEFRDSHPIKQAATVQHAFMQIFPFAEHSGKVGRMLTNLVLMRGGYQPCLIHSIDRQRYYESLKGPVAAFRTLLMDALENSLDNGVEFFQEQSRTYRSV
ncbi:MAG: Fic family protein [Myxococcaceae bacterium]